MAWKAERWLQDLFPGKDNICSEYHNLPRRELVIVASAVLDAALAELLTMRLADKPRECEEFLGLNEDGRAPCASFGARIQLALLLNIITEADGKILRLLKNIRNKLAHRAKADLNSSEVLPLLHAMNDALTEQSNRLIELGHLPGPKHSPELGIKEYLDTVPEAGAGLVLVMFTIYHAYFYRLSGIVIRTEPFRVPDRV